MQKQSLADELSDLRDEIARLQRRETELRLALLAVPEEDVPLMRVTPRPGWPIRREALH